MYDDQLTPHPDPEMREFEEALMRSVGQARRSEFARVHTPADIAARRKAGRPVGAVKAAPKQSTTIRLSPEVMVAFKATGRGWQTRIDAALKEWLQTHSLSCK
jgi:uncharacterized protein (DUF4415 family)